MESVRIIATGLALVPFYLIGAFPTGRIIAKHYGVAIETVGSGNVGATNVARTIGKKAGLLTLIVDMLKGLLSTTIAFALTDGNTFPALAACTVVLGHCYSIPGHLKGGKGVSTAFGAILCLSPWTATAGLIAFIAVMASTRIVSAASVTGSLIAPIAALLGNESTEPTAAAALIGIMITLRHWSNLQRLVEGREKRFHFIASSSAPKINRKA